MLVTVGRRGAMNSNTFEGPFSVCNFILSTGPNYLRTLLAITPGESPLG